MLVRRFCFLNGAVGWFGGLLACCADARGASFSWSAPDVCPSQTEVAERVDAARGGPLTDETEVTFDAEVGEGSPGHLTLTVRTRVLDQGEGAAQARTLTATDCEELVTAFVQMVSLALGPYVAPQSVEPSSEEAPVAAEAPPTAKAADAAGSDDDALDIRAAPSITRDESFRVTALAVLDTGSFGTASVGAHVGVGVSLGSAFELRGVVGYVPGHTVGADRENTRAGGRFSLVLGGLLACAVGSGAPWRVPFCVGMEAGNWSASGSGVSAPEADDVLWLAARAEVLVGVQLLPGLRVVLLGGFVFPLLQHEFALSRTPFHRIPAASPRVGLGLEYGF